MRRQRTWFVRCTPALAGLAFLAAACSSVAGHSGTAVRTSPATISAPQEDTQPDGLPALPGSWDGTTTTSLTQPVLPAGDFVLPNFVGESWDAASSQYLALDHVQTTANQDVGACEIGTSPNTVTSQVPPAGSVVAPETTVTLSYCSYEPPG